MDGESFALLLLAGAKWVTYLGLMGLTGAGAVSRLLAPSTGVVEPRGGAVERRLRLVAAASAVVLVLGAAARLYTQTWSVFGLDEPVTLELVRLVGVESRWANGWQPQAGVAVLAVVGAAWWTRWPRGGWWLTALAAVGAWITLPLTGHAASFESPLPHLAQVAHGIGAGLWVGGLAVVVAVTSRLRREPEGRGRVADLVRRFSPMALAAVLTIALSGVVASVFYLGSVGDLWATPYGRALLLKVGLFLATGAVGVFNWRRLTPRLGEASGPARLLRSARLELVVAAAVLLVTAVLVHLAMPREMM
jgi:putative copper export protein